MKYQFLLLIACFCMFHSKAQVQMPNYQNMVPASAEAAAFAKNIDIPMSYSSGTPQIGIPLFNLKAGTLELPVSLSYNASGIRVDETPTWVGLGWNLNVGGSLTRSVRGLPDDKQDYGYIHSPTNRKVKYVASLFYFSSELLYINNTLLPDNQVDLEPDIFAFSAMGYSGKFYYNQDSSKFILSPFQNIKIECSSMVNITEFILTLPNGVKCYFGGDISAREIFDYSYSTSYVNGSAQAGGYTPISDYITSWHIMSFVEPTGKKIEYSYINNQSIDFGRGGESYDDASSNRSASFYHQGFYKPVLQSISGESADIFFRPSSVNRLDAAGACKSLDTIIMKDKFGVIIKSYLLQYGYFTSPDSILLWGINNYAGIARKRLYLKSVTEKGNSALPPYQFTYNSTELPSRLSASQDYWGYYNGKNNGQFLMPRVPFQTAELPQGYAILPDVNADRRIDTNFQQARMLNKIKYPTGGTVEYFYEPNNVSQSYFNTLNGYSFEPPDMVEKGFSFMALVAPDPPYPLNFSDTFSITRPVTKVKIIPTLTSPCNTIPNASCKYRIEIRSLPGNTLISTINTTNSFYLYLPEGQYKIESISTRSPNEFPSFLVILEWNEFPDPNNFLVGGLRVRKIIIDDSVGNKIIKSFNYNSSSSAISSGILQGYPVHIMNIYDTLGTFMRQVLYSNSIMPLTTDGQTVLYQNVTEFYDAAQTSFKTEYLFSSDFRMLKFNNQDGSPPLVKDWQNHHLLRKTIFEKTATGYQALLIESNFYKSDKTLEHLFGMQGQYLRRYNIATEWWLLDYSLTSSYSYPNGQVNVLQTDSRNSYNDKFLLSNVRSTNSKGQVIDSKIKYPSDYNDVSGYNINTLLQKNILTVPISQETSVNGKIRSGSIMKYNVFGLPSESYAYENAILTDTVNHNKNVVLGSNYVLKTNVYYSSKNNPSQVVNTGGDIVTYLWNLAGTYPIAQVKNADSASVAFTSFETDGVAKWAVSGASLADNTAMTGTNVYNLSGGNITKSALSTSKTFIVSYWKKTVTGPVSVNSVTPVIGQTAKGWTYYEHKIVNPAGGLITVSGSGTIDELRLYSEKALMTSYTYRPMVGVSSICDPNNNIACYEYDGLGRLSLVRDENSNIIKKICYNYNGLTVDCGDGN